MLELIRSGRLWRMCVKELRETLRDRRTLFTLILMPLLVYPVLSMALQRLILTSHQDSSLQNYLIGVADEADVEKFAATILAGQTGVTSGAYRALHVDRGENGRVVDESAKPTANWRVVVDRDLDAQLLAGRFDLAVRISDTDRINDDGPPGKLSIDSSRRFDVQFRSGDSQSEAALHAFERLLQSINEQQSLQLRQKLGLTREAMVELSATSVGEPLSLVSSIAAVIPLILLLMTITGAVYPAIDLTAGERERGTMEALISTPVPRLGLLLSKYVAVVTVSILTAMVNLSAMFVTLSVGGLGRAILGNDGFPWQAILQIFPLLVLFSGFFSSILLALCCVARSFKEAQAYLIPVMLLSLGPGVLSVLPGVELTLNMAVVPLFNMILLARDVLAGHAQWLPALIAIISTMIYSIAFMAVAAKLFGRFAIAQSSETKWRVFWLPSQDRNKLPNPGDLSIFLALFFPVYFVATNTIGVAEDMSLANRLWVKSGLTAVLFLMMPIAYAWWQGLDLARTFRFIGDTRWLALLPGLVLIACGAWTMAHEIFVFSEWLGIASLRTEQIDAAKETKIALQRLPLWLIWLTMAIVPAVSEEVFFRGFALRCLQATAKPGIAILLSATLFGLFHVFAGSILAIERFLPTAALGCLLAWLAWRTQSLLPGIMVHAGHNGLLFTMAYYEESLHRAGWGVQDQRHLPILWILLGIAATLIGIGYVHWLSKSRNGS